MENSRKYRLIALVSGSCLCIWATVWLSSKTSAAGMGPGLRTQAPGLTGLPAGDLHPVGAGSCASTACHGGDSSRGIKGSEYTVWVESDPHARAYAVLHDPRSDRIVKNLKGEYPAYNNQVCLGCHATTNSSSDGVGCETCHGAARNWLSTHYLPGWKQMSAAAKADLGMLATKKLSVRAQACVECHVGSGARDVNHDLIAAGHPRLNFEFGSYLAILPKHWREREDKARYPDLEARAWALGQVTSARAALQLLADRAADKKKPWPEFAEYECAACHHQLSKDGRRPSTREPGALPWSGWYYALLSDALPVDSDHSGRISGALRNLGEAMKKPYPDRNRIAEQARDTAAQVLEIKTAPVRTPGNVRRLLTSLLERDIPLENRDGSAQRYLAVAALYHCVGDLGYPDPEIKTVIRGMRARLEVSQANRTPGEARPKTIPK
jgi:hypothetical protein